MQKTRSFAMITVGLFLILSGCNARQPAAIPALPREVTVITVHTETPSASLLTSGSFEYRNTIALSFETGGKIQTISAAEGQHVAQGELLALLASEDLLNQARLVDTQLQQARLQLQQAQNGATAEQLAVVASQLREAQLAYANVLDQYNRYSGLYAEGVISERQLKEVETALAAAEQKVIQADANLSRVKKGATVEEIALLKLAVSQAELQLTLAEHQLAKVRLTAPAAGVIIKKTANPGEMVGPGHPVLVMGDELIFAFAATSAQLPALHQGQRIQITRTDMNGLPSLEGTILAIASLPDPATRLYRVEAQIAAGQDTSIRAGTIGRVTLDIPAPGPVILLPAEAVVSKNNRLLVYTVGQEKRAQAVEITVGNLVDGRLEILTGLAGGETIIVEGAPFILDGEEIRIKEGGLQ